MAPFSAPPPSFLVGPFFSPLEESFYIKEGEPCFKVRKKENGEGRGEALKFPPSLDGRTRGPAWGIKRKKAPGLSL